MGRWLARRQAQSLDGIELWGMGRKRQKGDRLTAQRLPAIPQVSATVLRTTPSITSASSRRAAFASFACDAAAPRSRAYRPRRVIVTAIEISLVQ